MLILIHPFGQTLLRELQTDEFRITLATLEGLAEDRRRWRSLVKDIMAAKR